MMPPERTVLPIYAPANTNLTKTKKERRDEIAAIGKQQQQQANKHTQAWASLGVYLCKKTAMSTVPVHN